MKEDWEELIRSDFCLYNIAVPAYSTRHSNEFVKGPKYGTLLLYIKDSIGRYYENFYDHNKVGKYLMEQFKDKDFYQNYIRFWHKTFDELDRFLRYFRKNKLSEFDDQALANLLEETYKKSIYWHGVAYNVDAIDTVLIPMIENLIKEKYHDKKKSKISEIYNILTFPRILSYSNRMEIEKLKLMLKNPDDKQIKRFTEKYYWINFKWGDSKEYTKKDFKYEHIPDIRSELNKIQGHIKRSLEKKEHLLNEINNKILNEYIDIFDDYAVLHDLRKEGQVKSVYYIRQIYKEYAKRVNIDHELLYFLWPMELVVIIQGKTKIDVELLNKRSEEWFCILENDGSFKEYFGKEARKILDMKVGYDTKHQKELSGLAASPGRINGIAKVCLSAKEANEKISNGDILITGMTMPEFVPAMKKAGAIVTDEGGLTCHAAIIARELGKPCVVGTKMATRLITNGSIIEVNANHGVVKVLK